MSCGKGEGNGYFCPFDFYLGLQEEKKEMQEVIAQLQFYL